MTRSLATLLLLALALLVGAPGCSKFKAPANPFDQPTDISPGDTTTVKPDMGSITGLHARIFVPTCANSGCHDGTFEPDFRTIESTYNTLVYHPIIKNDPLGSYSYRVVPGNPGASQLMARLTYDIDGQSGIMPLIVDPNAEWHTENEAFIQHIRDWIVKGAPDIFGQTYSLLDNLPTVLGVLGKAGNQTLGRADGGQGAMRIPLSIPEITLYFALSDDKTLPQNLEVNQIRFASGPDQFDGANPLNLEVLDTPLNGPGFQGQAVSYTHRITIQPHLMASLGETRFFRVYVRDNSNPLTEIPSNAGAYYIKSYFSFTIIP